MATDPARTTLSGFEPSKDGAFEKRLWQQRSVSSSPMEQRRERGFEARVRSNATAAARWLRVVLSKHRYSVRNVCAKQRHSCLESCFQSSGAAGANHAFGAAAQCLRSVVLGHCGVESCFRSSDSAFETFFRRKVASNRAFAAATQCRRSVFSRQSGVEWCFRSSDSGVGAYFRSTVAANRAFEAGRMVLSKQRRGFGTSFRGTVASNRAVEAAAQWLRSVFSMHRGVESCFRSSVRSKGAPRRHGGIESCVRSSSTMASERSFDAQGRRIVLSQQRGVERSSRRLGPPKAPRAPRPPVRI